MDRETFEEQPQPLVPTSVQELRQAAVATPYQGLRIQRPRLLSTGKECLRLQGLPDDAQHETIIEFLGQHAASVIHKGVHIIYNSEGQPSGEAIIQMDSEESASLALVHSHDRYMMGQKPSCIKAFLCTVDEMRAVLAGSAPGTVPLPPSAGAQLLELHDAQRRDQPPVPTRQPATAAILQPVVPPGPVTMLRVHGLPNTATEQDILAFFNGFPGLNPYGVYMMGIADRHFKGSAFVAVQCEAKYVRSVLDRQCNYICNRKIDLCIVDTDCAVRWLTAPSRAHLYNVPAPQPY